MPLELSIRGRPSITARYPRSARHVDAQLSSVEGNSKGKADGRPACCTSLPRARIALVSIATCRGRSKRQDQSGVKNRLTRNREGESGGGSGTRLYLRWRTLYVALPIWTRCRPDLGSEVVTAKGDHVFASSAQTFQSILGLGW